MNSDLMLDTLSAVIDRSQSQIQQIIRKNKPLSSKMRYVSLNLTQLKFQILQWLLNVIKQSKNIQSLQSKLNHMKTQTFQQLSHIRLHTLLKSKLNQLKKSSFLNSILINDQNQSQINQNQSMNDNNLSKLQQSVILLEKDMNIHEDEQQNQDFNVSAIIQKTKLNLLQDNYLNVSTFSQSSQFFAEHSLQPMKNIQFSLKDQSIFKDRLQFSVKETEISQKFVQNQNKQSNFNKSISKNQLNIQKEGLKNLNNVQDKEQKQKLKPMMIQKVMKKKKKNISSVNANSSSLNKQDLLGNLLQQAYDQHFQQTS